METIKLLGTQLTGGVRLGDSMADIKLNRFLLKKYV